MAKRSVAGPSQRAVFARSLATAHPSNSVSQDEVRDLMAGSARIEASRLERLLGVFANAGVKQRFAVLPLAELRKLRGWPARSACFVEWADILLGETNRNAIARSGLEPKDIDFVVSVTSTGPSVPDFAARQIGMLGLRPDVRRMPLYGFGCTGGVPGLAYAALLARAYPGSHVLLQVIELCMTHLDPETSSETRFVASALFGDGAASVVLSTEGPGLFSIGSGYEEIIPGTQEAMAWEPGDDGFKMVLGVEVPDIVESHVGRIAQGFFRQSGLTRQDVDFVVAHPGSRKIVEATERGLGLEEGSLVDSRVILENYGNMSAATVFFILDKKLKSNAAGTFLILGLGPGVTAALVDGEMA